MDEKPPDGYGARAPAEEDAPTVAALIAACQLADAGEAEMNEDELLDDWKGLELAQEAVVVETPGGTLAGYADVLNRSYVSVSVYGYVHPEHRRRGVGGYLVGRAVGAGPDAPSARRLARGGAALRGRPQRRHAAPAGGSGLRAREGRLPDVHRAGAGPARARVAAGDRGGLAPGRDERRAYEAVEDAFRDVWGRPRNTFERFLGFTRQEGFDPTLWFLAEDGGEIAGSCLCKTVAGRGEVDVLGVRRPWRGRGLGLALLRHAFGEFYDRGVREVGLSVDAESPTGAPRLYVRAGMRVAEAYAVYQKELRAGEDPGDHAAIG